jgi:hypothetical protein
VRVHVANAYVEYSREGTRLARLFRTRANRGLVHNISKSGIQFRTTERLNDGETLYLKLHFPQVNEVVRAKAQVRWVREEPWAGIESYTHVVGAELIEVPSKAWTVLQDLSR